MPRSDFATEREACRLVAQFLAERFIYTPDPPRADVGIADQWPPRAQLEGQLLGTGKIRDDCDGAAFGSVYCLADLGIKGRVILCWTEPVFDASDGQVAPRYHMVAESEAGYVIDVARFPGKVLTWASDELRLYTRDKMSGFFEFGEVAAWSTIDNTKGFP